MYEDPPIRVDHHAGKPATITIMRFGPMTPTEALVVAEKLRLIATVARSLIVT